jgi:sulfur-oxidizing protein SoxY
VGKETQASGLGRRSLVKAIWAGSVGLLGLALAAPRTLAEGDEALAIVIRLVGKTPVPSDRIRIEMPAVFENGYSVPFALEVASAMTEAEHVRNVRVFAPQNPLVEVAGFNFTPGSGRARVTTRIRVAEPQFIFAVAEMSDGALLMAKKWVKVEKDGCA